MSLYTYTYIWLSVSRYTSSWHIYAEKKTYMSCPVSMCDCCRCSRFLFIPALFRSTRTYAPIFSPEKRTKAPDNECLCQLASSIVESQRSDIPVPRDRRRNDGLVGKRYAMTEQRQYEFLHSLLFIIVQPEFIGTDSITCRTCLSSSKEDLRMCLKYLRHWYGNNESPDIRAS